MTNGSSGLQQHEYYLVPIDGRTKSKHKRLIDALRVGLQLRDQFPAHMVKARSAKLRIRSSERTLNRIADLAMRFVVCIYVIHLPQAVVRA